MRRGRNGAGMLDVVIASYLEPELVARIAAARADVRVHARPDLVPPPRYAADHVGAPFERSAAEDAEWRALLGQAQVLFDFDYVRPRNLLEHAPRLRWVQASSSGIGQFVGRHGLHESGIVFTTAAGIHARPLAEFVVWASLAAVKGYARARAQQRAGVWERFHGAELAGATLLMVGLGSIGRAVADLMRPLGVRVVGTKREIGGFSAADLGVDALIAWTRLSEALPEADIVVLACPLTPQTAGMIGAEQLRRCKPGSVLVNIGRGGLIDHQALLRSLSDGRPALAVLDVTDPEPLPPEHPLWGHERVILFPHSASTSHRENARLVDLFLDNLDRFAERRPLRNVYQHERGY